MIELEVVSLAAPVSDLLSQASHGAVLGSTGKAAFVKVGCSVVVLAPVGGPRMPNEITIRGRLPDRGLQPETIVDLSPGELRSIGWKITWNQNSIPVWLPAVPSRNGAAEDIEHRGMRILQGCGFDPELLSERPADCILTIDPSIGVVDRSRDAIARCFAAICSRSSDIPVSDVIGCGHGLTPSGDDFVCALILAGRAWGLDECPPSLPSGEIHLRTSSLSATLLTLANNGMGLEPLTVLFDMSATERDLKRSLEQLLMMGHSTGRVYAATIGLIGISMSKVTNALELREERCL